MKVLEEKVFNYLINNKNKIKINSIDVLKGDVFVALKGSKIHGNKYIEDAFVKKAKYVISDYSKKNYNNINLLKVKKPLDFLLKVAKVKRKNFLGKVIAVTGSVGKTSIKELIYFFLNSQFKTSSSIKSYNNYLGILLSLINMDMNSKFSIFEIGTNHTNEINILSSLVLPHQIVISNIGPTHLENFQTTRNIAIEKSDIMNPKYNPNVELAVLPNSNSDELFLINLAKKYNISSIVTFGKNEKSDYKIQKIEKINNFLAKVIYKTPYKEIMFKTSTSFTHQIINMLIPVIIFDYNNLKLSNLTPKATKIPFVEGRGLFHNIFINSKKIILIDESYNASPISMKNCIEYFKNFEIKSNQRKIMIIGEMLELGKMSHLFHKQIVLKAIKSSINIIIFCGDMYNKILTQINYDEKQVFCFDRESKIINFLNDKTLKNDIILAKGSNSSKINKLVYVLLEKGKNNC